jgi:hypothetical protein
MVLLSCQVKVLVLWVIGNAIEAVLLTVAFYLLLEIDFSLL